MTGTIDPDWTGLDPALVGWLEPIGGAAIDANGPASDLATWFDIHDVRWAPQRPGFSLFGTASDLDGPRHS